MVLIISEFALEWHRIGSDFDHALIARHFTSQEVVEKGRSFAILYKSDFALNDHKECLRSQLNSVIEQVPHTWNPHMAYECVNMMLRTKARTKINGKTSVKQ